MRISAVDECVQTSTAGDLPLRLEQRASAGPAIARGLMALPLAALSASLLAVIGSALVADAHPLALLAAKPEAAIGLLSGLAVTVAVIAHPLSAAAARIGRRQTVEITADRVTISSTSPFGRSVDVVPLGHFIGLAHHIRSCLSGVRHEIVLVHRDPARSVLLSASAKVLQADLDRVAATLRLPIVPASALYAKATKPSGAVVSTDAGFEAIAA